jgi:CRP-like cAMP-binding protein
METQPTVRLFEVDPDLGGFLTAEDRADAHRVSLPVVSVAKGDTEISVLLHSMNAFGAFLLDGMLLQRLGLSDQLAVRLLGPGDLIAALGSSHPMVLSESQCHPAVPTRLALLGNEMLIAAHRWPRLVAALHVRMGQQAERLAAQLAICQLPRVDQRLLALMWLLAESWGRVTSAGTALPLTLTHETLGALVGARRPTVTLALQELAGRGAMVHQDSGWLLLEEPVKPTGTSAKVLEAEVLDGPATQWAEQEPPVQDLSAAYQHLMETVHLLKLRHLEDKAQLREQLERVRVSRTRHRLAREQIARRRRSAPYGLHHHDRR